MPPLPLTALDLAHFQTFGFLVLRDYLASPVALCKELKSALVGSKPLQSSVATFTFAPLMSQSTPHSLALLDALAPIASTLLGGQALPIRAKGQRYEGATSWHRDSSGDPPSLGCLAYLEGIPATGAALHVLPGSHQPEFAAPVADYLAHGGGNPAQPFTKALPFHPIQAQPSDVILFDERLYHASPCPAPRLQFRVDYMLAPTDTYQSQACHAYLAQIFDARWDGGYDPDSHPNYDQAWLTWDRPWVEVLARLGAYTLAWAQEAAMRSKRSL